MDRFAVPPRGSLTPRCLTHFVPHVLAQRPTGASSVVAAHSTCPLMPAAMPARAARARSLLLSEGTCHGADQTSHPRQAARQAPDSPRLGDQRDPVRVRALHRRADGVRHQPGDRHRPRQGQGLPAVAGRPPGLVRAATRGRRAERATPGHARGPSWRPRPRRSVPARDPMLRALLDARLLLATLCAAAVGLCGLRAYPFDRSDVFLAVIEARRPDIAQGLAYGYATLWFTTPFCARVPARVARRDRRVPAGAAARSTDHCRAIRSPRTRPAPSLVLGEMHFTRSSGPRAGPAVARRFRSGGSTPASWCWAPSAPARRPRACIRTWTSCSAGERRTPTARSAASCWR